MMADAEGEAVQASEVVLIRPVRLEDVEALHEIRRQPSMIDFTLALPSERIADSRRFLEGFGPDDHALVALVNDQVVGMAGLHVRRGKLRHGGEIGMMVHERFQGQGVGRKLLEALLDVADNHLGLVRVELEVFPDNDRAIGLYERLGFEHEGRKRKAILRHGGPADVLLMARVR